MIKKSIYYNRKNSKNNYKNMKSSQKKEKNNGMNYMIQSLNIKVNKKKLMLLEKKHKNYVKPTKKLFQK